ncbi:MAG: PfkB family carbohydrate kinase [Vescimonas sp.]
MLGKLHTLKPNRLEAELLSGVPITDTDSLHRAAQTLLETGLHRVFISLGADGVYAADQSGSVTPARPAGGDGQHHRLRRCLHGRSDLGLSCRASDLSRHGPCGSGGLRHRPWRAPRPSIPP